MIKAPAFIVFGAVGKGKSTLLNHICYGDDPNHHKFSTSSDFDSCTVAVTSCKGKIYGTDKEVEFYDVPGLLGLDMDLEQWKAIVDLGFAGKNFNGVLWVVSAKDRPTAQDAIIKEGMEYLLNNFSANNVILALTHCDLLKRPIDTMALADDWMKIFNKSVKQKFNLMTAMTFGIDKTSYYTPHYRQELVNVVDQFNGTMTIQKEVDFKQFNKSIMDKIDPRIHEAVDNLLAAELKKTKQENEQFLKKVLEENQEHLKAVKEASQPHWANKLLEVLAGGINAYCQHKQEKLLQNLLFTKLP